MDPKSAREIHMHNRKRVIRALEYYHQTGETISEHNEREQRRVSPYNALYFVLTDDRSKLYRRIEQRVDQMMQQGLMEEVKALKEAGCTRDMTSMQGLGYRELLAWMDGEHASLEAAVMDIKKNTRHFAKRQLTWFRRERNVIWLDKSLYQDDESAILKDILCRCDEAHMIKETEDTQKGIHGKWN